MLEPHPHWPMRRKKIAHSVSSLGRSTSFLQGQGPLYSHYTVWKRTQGGVLSLLRIGSFKNHLSEKLLPSQKQAGTMGVSSLDSSGRVASRTKHQLRAIWGLHADIQGSSGLSESSKVLFLPRAPLKARRGRPEFTQRCYQTPKESKREGSLGSQEGLSLPPLAIISVPRHLGQSVSQPPPKAVILQVYIPQPRSRSLFREGQGLWSSRPTPLPTVLHMDALSPLYVGGKGSAAESLTFENHSHEKSLPKPKYGPGPSQDARWCP